MGSEKEHSWTWTIPYTWLYLLILGNYSPALTLEKEIQENEYHTNWNDFTEVLLHSFYRYYNQG